VNTVTVEPPTCLNEAVTTAVHPLRLTELAERSGLPVRTIRYYQSQKLIPAPSRRGREAMYGEEHLERLHLVADLRDRGLPLGTIRELVAGDRPTRTVAEWLGVDATLRAPWSDDRPGSLTQDELVALVERESSGRPGVIGALHDAGYVEPSTDGGWNVPSPALLEQALRLERAGVDVDVSARMRDLLRRRLAKAVDDTVKLLVERAGAGFAGAGTPGELATALGALRPIARETSSVILAQEVERALAALVDAGPRSVRRR